jgi:hypothetical protein
MACDCDELANRLRDYDRRLRNLENGGSGNTGGGRGGNDDLIERVFKDKRWLAICDCVKFIIKGKV